MRRRRSLSSLQRLPRRPSGGRTRLRFRKKLPIKAAAPSDELPPRVQPSAVEDRAASADDLTRIRSINRALAARLTDAGISSFAQIAAWNGDEVRRVARDMELDQRIWREGWIEQAAALILKAGGTLPEIARGAPAADVTSRVAAVQPDDRGGDGKAETPVVVAPAVNEFSGQCAGAIRDVSRHAEAATCSISRCRGGAGNAGDADRAAGGAFARAAG